MLALYDSERVKGSRDAPRRWLHAHSWEEADKAIMGKLDELSKAGKRIVVLTGTVISPATRQAIDKLKNRFGGSTVEQEDGLEVSMGGRVDHVQYDTISYAGLTRANKACFGKAVMPSYDLTKADARELRGRLPEHLGQHHRTHLASTPSAASPRAAT